jgi:predicted DNA-binding ribbon-helix-helix protein
LKCPCGRPTESQREAAGKIVQHSLSVAGHRTSISLEWAFWDELKGIANALGQPLASLVAAVVAGLSSAITMFVLNAARRSP